MIRMLIVGYMLASRSEQALCRELLVNLAYPMVLSRLLSLEDKTPDHSAFLRTRP